MRVEWAGGWGVRWCGVGGVAGARHLTTARVDGARDEAVVRVWARLHGGTRGSPCLAQAWVWGRESDRAGGAPRGAVRAGRRWESRVVAAVGDTGCVLRPPRTLARCISN